MSLQGCPGCNDQSFPLAFFTDTDNIVGAGPGENQLRLVATAGGTATVQPVSGICEFKELAPPYSHIIVCQEKRMCLPIVTISIEVTIQNGGGLGEQNSFDVTCSGTICSAGHPNGNVTGSFGIGPITIEVFNQPVRVACNDQNCPIDVEYTVAFSQSLNGNNENVFWSWAAWPDEASLHYGGQLKCTSCDTGAVLGGGGNG